MREHLVTFGLTMAAFFSPIWTSMLAVGCLIGIDTITGILGARKIGEKITSKRLSSVIYKMIAYQLIIITAHLCESYLFKQVPFLSITLAFLAMVEFYSVAENFQKITGKNLLKYVREFIEDKFKKTIKKEDELG